VEPHTFVVVPPNGDWDAAAHFNQQQPHFHVHIDLRNTSHWTSDAAGIINEIMLGLGAIDPRREGAPTRTGHYYELWRVPQTSLNALVPDMPRTLRTMLYSRARQGTMQPGAHVQLIVIADGTDTIFRYMLN
jgi:hypothetical protein